MNARIVAATHRDLEQMLRQGTFREDLFYRLNVVPVVLPPLRERREDIVPLAEHFLGVLGTRHGRRLQLSAGATDRLLRYAWPGNIRELQNALERTAVLIDHEVIEVADLPAHIAAGITLGAAPPLAAQQTMTDIEKAHIRETLERCGWNHSRTAEALGIGRTTLWRKLKEYGIEGPA